MADPISIPREPLPAILPAAVLLLLLVAGCTSWRQELRPVPQVVAEKPNVVMRIHTGYGPPVTISHVRLAGDTLVGSETIEGRRNLFYDREVRIPLSTVASTEVRYVDGGKTALLVVGIGATVALVAAIAIGNAFGDGGSSQPAPSDGTTWSCPTLASWNGSEWLLDSGTFAGAIMPALERTDVDALQHARSERGTVRLRLEGANQEVDHVDAVELLAVDHTAGSEIIPDAAGALHALRDPRSPAGARDDRRADALARVDRLDGWGWESSPTASPVEARPAALEGLEVTFPRPAGARYAWLVVDGNNTPWGGLLLKRYVALHGRDTQAWMDSIGRSAEAVQSLASAIGGASALRVLLAAANDWIPQGAIPGAGPEVVKRQAIRLDLEGRTGREIRVRLESLPLSWWIDRVSLHVADEAGLETRPVPLARATAGNGASLLATLEVADHRMAALRPGERVALEFAAPSPRAGKRQTFVARTTGWYRLEVDETVAPEARRLASLDADPLALARWGEELRREAVRRLSGVLEADPR